MGDTAKYKQVTVLFADVVRSMDIAAVLDLERLREVMTELVQRSAAVAQRYGGTVEYNGDGVMALFGAPVALEDHALRGCLAALAIQQEATRLAAEVARRDGVNLQLRVGLNSGRVIAGDIALGYAATGETVGFAQRIESAAGPGEVLLSESTARLVEHTAVLGEPDCMWLRDRVDFLIRVVDVWVGRERARRGDRDAIPVMREAVDKLHGTAQVFYGVWAAGVLIETLLERGTEADIREAEERIDRLTNWWPDSFPDSPVRVIMLLRLRALLARARGDHAYPDLVRRYCLAAESACFEGHLAWAKAMAEVEEQRC